MQQLLNEIRSCRICADFLPEGPRPIVSGSDSSKLLIIGQAPGRRVHASGIPWDDPSGKQLRLWLGMSDEDFYDQDKVALVPMGFCYPGSGKSGDLPPRPECAPTWHESLLENLKSVQLTLLIGQYAQKHYLKSDSKKNLTETVRNYKDYPPKYIPLPHPSPRNRIWVKKNAWFESDLVPLIQRRVAELF